MEFALPGEREGKIWMWHRCLKCPRIHGFPPATRRIVMSDAAWGLSFGKFLELSFSNHAAASRVASCGHSLHRDCLRFYGYTFLLLNWIYNKLGCGGIFAWKSKGESRSGLNSYTWECELRNLIFLCLLQASKKFPRTVFAKERNNTWFYSIFIPMMKGG